MRRLLGFVVVCTLGAAPATIATSGVAGAHTCATPVEIPVGEPVGVTVGVTVEGTPVPDIEIVAPPELQLASVDPSPDWTLVADGQRVRATGPAVPANSCKFFTLRVTAVEKGAYGITVVQRDANGTVVAESAPVPGQAIEQTSVQGVYAGVKIPTGESTGPPVALWAGVGLLVVAGTILATVSLRNRRAAAREDELEDRLEEFRKQARARRSGPVRP